jgi:hypothetical protein
LRRQQFTPARRLQLVSSDSRDFSSGLNLPGRKAPTILPSFACLAVVGVTIAAIVRRLASTQPLVGLGVGGKVGIHEPY